MPSAGIMASAVNVATGPCTDVLSEPFDNIARWTTVGGTPSIVAGRTGAAVQLGGGTTLIQYTIPSANESDVVTVGFATFVVSSILSTEIIYLRSDAGATDHIALQVLSTGALQLLRGGASISGTTAAGTIPVNTWKYIEVQAKLSDTAGFVTVRVDGVEVLTATVTDTKNAGIKTTFDTVRLKGNSGNGSRYDDLYVSTGSGCAFKGSQSIVVTCADLLTEPFNSLASWITVSGTPALTQLFTGRSGTAAQVRSGEKIDYRLLTESDYVTVGFAVRCLGSLSTTTMLLLRSDTGASDHLGVIISNTGQITLTAGGLPIGGTSLAGTVQAGTWTYIEVQARLHDTAGFVIVRANGAVVINSTGLDTKIGGTKTTFDTVRLGGNHASSFTYIDDVYISVGSECTFKGDPLINADPCQYLQEPFDDTGNWFGAFTSVVPGRTNPPGVQLTSFANADHKVWTARQADTMWVGFAYRWTDALGARNIIALRSDTGTPDQLRLSVNPSTGALGLARFTTNIANSAAGVMGVTNQWYYVEIAAKLHDTTGWCKVRVNGVEVIDFVGDTRNSTSKTVWDAIQLFNGLSGAINQYDDLYIAMGDSCAFQGDHVIAPQPSPWIAATNSEASTSLGSANSISAPTSQVAGDLLLAFAVVDAPSTTDITASAGWTRIRHQVQGADVIKMAAFARIADGTASDTIAVTGALQDYCVRNMSIRNHAVVNVATDILIADATGSTGNTDPPALNPGVARDWLWLAVNGVDFAATLQTITAVPAGYTLLGTHLASASSTSSCGLSVGFKTADTTSEDPGTFVNNPTTRPWIAFTLAIPKYGS